VIHVETLIAGGDNFIYVLDDGEQAYVVDPTEANPVLKFVRQKKRSLAAILNTHNHYDHTGGNKPLQKEYGCCVVSRKRKEPPCIDGQRIEIMNTPGHTNADVCFFIAGGTHGAGMLFTGDTLFVNGCGRVFSGRYDHMFSSLQKIKALPDDTIVYCGHNYTEVNYQFALTVDPDNAQLKESLAQLKSRDRLLLGQSTVGDEKNKNPFFRTAEPAITKSLGLKTASELEVFTALRKRKDAF